MTDSRYADSRIVLHVEPEVKRTPRLALGGQARAAAALAVTRAGRRTAALRDAPGRALRGNATARRCEAGRFQTAGPLGRRRSLDESEGCEGQGEKEQGDSLLHDGLLSHPQMQMYK